MFNMGDNLLPIVRFFPPSPASPLPAPPPSGLLQIISLLRSQFESPLCTSFPTCTISSVPLFLNDNNSKRFTYIPDLSFALQALHVKLPDICPWIA